MCFTCIYLPVWTLFRELRVAGDAHLLGRWETADCTLSGFRQRYLHVCRFQRGGQCTQELPPHRTRYMQAYVRVCSSTVFVTVLTGLFQCHYFSVSPTQYLWVRAPSWDGSPAEWKCPAGLSSFWQPNPNHPVVKGRGSYQSHEQQWAQVVPSEKWNLQEVDLVIDDDDDDDQDQSWWYHAHGPWSAHHWWRKIHLCCHQHCRGRG